MIPKMLAGPMALFIIERLVHSFTLLGPDVEVRVHKTPRGERHRAVRARFGKMYTIPA